MPSNDKELKKIKKGLPTPDALEKKQNEAIGQAFFGDKNGKAIIDENLCWVAFNEAYAKEFYNFFGVKPSLGTSLKDTQPKNKKAFDKILQDLEKAIGGKIQFHRAIRQLPSPNAIALCFQPILLNGNIKAVTVSFIKLEKEETLLGPAHKMQDFTELANLIPHMIWIADAEGSIQFINNFWSTYTGGCEETSLAEAYSKVVHDEDRSQLRDRWNKAVASQSLYEGELRLKNREGQYRWFVSRARPIKDRQGNVLRWVGINMEVHDYKAITQTLKQQQGFIRALADNMPAFILSLDGQGHIRFANSFHQKLGFNPEELIGQPFYSAYTLKDVAYAQALQKAIEKALQGSEERVLGRIYDTNGEIIEVETVVHPYKNGTLHSLGVVLLSFDITRHKQERESLQNQTRILQEVNNDFDLLFHRMAHDIYSPLNSLEGLFQLLLAEPGITKSQKPLLKHMESSLKKFRNTLSHITSWVAASAKSQTSREQIKLADLMKELMWDMQETISQTNTSIETIYNLPYFEISGRNLRSILYNIISNSIKYRKHNVPPKIKVTFFETSDYECCIEIQDNGMGIKTSELNQVTEAFEKLDPRSNGLGLGMYVVKRIVERYLGTIEIESVVGKGTTLCLFLCPKEFSTS